MTAFEINCTVAAAFLIIIGIFVFITHKAHKKTIGLTSDYEKRISCLTEDFEKEISNLKNDYKNRIRQLTNDKKALEKTLTNNGIAQQFDKIMKYYVMIRTAKGKEYTLPADVLISAHMIIQPEFKFNGWNAIDFRITAYVLLKVYWENGGFVHFSSEKSLDDTVEPQVVKLNKPVTVTDLSGNEYTVTLTDNLADENTEINRIRAEANKFDRHIKNKFNDLHKISDAVRAEISRFDQHIKTKFNDLHEFCDAVRAGENKFDQHIKNTFNDLHKLRDEVLIDYPYFAALIADYEKYTNDRYAHELKHKNRPAPKAAQIISNNSEKIRSLTRENKLLTYQMEIYESFFPFLADYKEISKEDFVRESETVTDEENENKIFSEYLSPQEYNSLSPEEKCTLALERYKKKKKTLWQVGRDYERYIGYLYESKGYAVEYFGAVKGFADLGRDLIATKGSETLIIQCKYWNEHKTVHEKHIFQLFGTSFEYTYQHPDKNVKAVFVTSTGLSEMSLKFAESLHIEVIQNLKYDNTYPMIKCNINRTTGEKIFHLPFDLQYDNVIIEPQKGECYAATVAEAAEKGFRHSYKWHTSKPAD